MNSLAWLNPSIVQASTGSKILRAAEFVPFFIEACGAYEINRTWRLAPFFANVGHESQGLEHLQESLNYSADRLTTVFGEHRITEDQAQRYGRTDEHDADQEAIANIVYGGAWGLRNLGNTEPGDGWKFSGKGPMQITGRANFRRLYERLRVKIPGCPNFEESPELVATPQWGAWAAADYWGARNLNALADARDFDGICDKINMGRKTAAIGDANGYADRLKRLERAQAAMRHIFGG